MFQTISMRQLEEFLNRGGSFTLLDVRTRDEFAQGHLEGAVNIPLEELGENAGMLARDRPVIVYCAHGSHSMMAARMLDRLGFVAVNAVGGLSSYRGTHFR